MDRTHICMCTLFPVAAERFLGKVGAARTKQGAEDKLSAIKGKKKKSSLPSESKGGVGWGEREREREDKIKGEKERGRAREQGKGQRGGEWRAQEGTA